MLWFAVLKPGPSILQSLEHDSVKRSLGVERLGSAGDSCGSLEKKMKISSANFSI